MPDPLIRVAYVIGTLDVGGAESQLVTLARGLDPHRFVPSVYCLSDEGVLAGPLRDRGIPVHNLGMRGLHLARSPLKAAVRVGRLFSMLADARPDIVHGFLFHAYVAGALAGRWAGARAIVSSRRSLANFKKDRRLYRAVERVANRVTDLVIANSEAVRLDAIRTEGLRADKVIVIYNGLQIERCAPAASAALGRELDLEAAGPVVAVVANLIHYKAHDVLLDAWLEIRRDFPSATLLVAGDGPLRRTLEARARELAIAESVRFLGLRRDVPALLALADVVVQPSLEEGFCNAILEAMAAGKPVVATRVGGNPEAVVEGETGLLVPPGDAPALAGGLRVVLADAALRARLGDAARRRARERFDVEVMVRAYEQAYERLLIT